MELEQKRRGRGVRREERGEREEVRERVRWMTGGERRRGCAEEEKGEGRFGASEMPAGSGFDVVVDREVV